MAEVKTIDQLNAEMETAKQALAAASKKADKEAAQAVIDGIQAEINALNNDGDTSGGAETTAVATTTPVREIRHVGEFAIALQDGYNGENFWDAFEEIDEDHFISTSGEYIKMQPNSIYNIVATGYGKMKNKFKERPENVNNPEVPTHIPVLTFNMRKQGEKKAIQCISAEAILVNQLKGFEHAFPLAVRVITETKNEKGYLDMDVKVLPTMKMAQATAVATATSNEEAKTVDAHAEEVK